MPPRASGVPATVWARSLNGLSPWEVIEVTTTLLSAPVKVFIVTGTPPSCMEVSTSPLRTFCSSRNWPVGWVGPSWSYSSKAPTRARGC